MPAKKKSCFQITSVTPAQVAASALADDTESLEDPDESRAEEVVPRGDVVVGVAGGSSPLEEVSGIHGELLLGPANGGVSFRIVAPAAVGPQVGGAAPTGGSSQTLPTTTLPTSSCTSRFRVIKLDHGTGEPFRRGRWTCVEFYEKDPDSSGGSRAAESLRHASHLEHSLDRDSGLGTTVNSAAVSSMLSGQGPDAGLDGSFSSAPQVLQTEPPPQQSNGAVLPGAFQPAGHTPIPAQPAAVPQNLLPAGHDSAPQNVPPQQVQQSPGPPGYVYPGQLPPGHLISGQQTSPTDYRQPHLTVPQPQSTGGPLPAQGPLPTFIPAASGALPLGIPGQTLKPISQYQPSGGSPVGVGLQGVPAATSIAANQTLTSVEQPHVGRGLGVQAPFFGSSMEDSRKQPDALPQGPMSSLMDPSKLSVTENLQLPAPPVNNLFGIAISKDEDDDG
ncbi:TSC22 domain family protein 2-like [Arapaima gigas]